MSDPRYVLKAEPIEFTKILDIGVGREIQKSKVFGLSNWANCGFYCYMGGPEEGIDESRKSQVWFWMLSSDAFLTSK